MFSTCDVEFNNGISILRFHCTSQCSRFVHESGGWFLTLQMRTRWPVDGRSAVPAAKGENMSTGMPGSRFDLGKEMFKC